jgi:FKBP-type peptidyl-prolyl cis-trans isomerase SlpA
MPLSIDTGTSVTLHFSLALEDGHVVDSNFDTQPATFVVGDGNLLPGFEDPQNVQGVERGNFEQDELEIGAMYSFQNGDGELPGVIIEVGDDEVMIDFNHPLAGQVITFRVKIISVLPQRVH